MTTYQTNVTVGDLLQLIKAKKVSEDALLIIETPKGQNLTTALTFCPEGSISSEEVRLVQGEAFEY